MTFYWYFSDTFALPFAVTFTPEDETGPAQWEINIGPIAFWIELDAAE